MSAKDKIPSKFDYMKAHSGNFLDSERTHWGIIDSHPLKGKKMFILQKQGNSYFCQQVPTSFYIHIKGDFRKYRQVLPRNILGIIIFNGVIKKYPFNYQFRPDLVSGFNDSFVYDCEFFSWKLIDTGWSIQLVIFSTP